MKRARAAGSDNLITTALAGQNGCAAPVPGWHADVAGALLEGIREGAYLADRTGKIRVFNASAEVITGRTAGAVMGVTCAQALGCAQDRGCEASPPPDGGTWAERACRGTRADGSPLVLRVRTCWLRDERGRPAGYLGLFSETSLQESLQRKLVAHERLASLGELASSLVHEIGNPVGVILGFARLLVQEEGRDPGGEIRQRIYDEADRCRAIVGQFLDYARSSRSSPRPTPLNLGDLARDTIQLLSYRMLRQGVRWELAWEADIPLVEADPGEVKQVLLNVLLNAVEAMEGGGTLQVSGRRIERETTVGGDSLLSPRAAVLRRPWVELWVEDEGPGLGTLDPERAFEAFFTTKEKGGGLGLAVCRRILGAWGGEMLLQNRVGAGARAVLRLPAWESEGG
ncbi:MAG: ATP-binding protein [Deferrisomatales bacterium]|nr:ATP-binding protein [Deferrisomatales bacterium]